MNKNINQYWREQANKKYARNHPEVPVRKEALAFLTKKEAMGIDEDSTELLNETLNKIRAILTGESVDELEAHRRSR